jgi:hypothetical protein
MSDRDRLAGYVDVWWEAIDFTRLLRRCRPMSGRPHGPGGWDARMRAAHTAHLEAALRGSGDGRAWPCRVALPGLHRAGRGGSADATPDALINEIW